MQFALKVLTSIYVFLFVVAQIEGTYEVPAVTVEALKPQGLRVSLPANDDPVGIKFIEFHANINEDIGKEKEAGQIFIRVTAPYQGKWQFTDKSVELEKGDVLNFWVRLWINEHEQYTKYGLTYKVEDFVD